MSADTTTKRGTIYTFYSFKGGAGRSMALANVAALLAKWGHSVLVVDWDLEAPGLERFFTTDLSAAKKMRANHPGIIDLINAKRNSDNLHWRDCVVRSSSGVSLITAGREDGEYPAKVQHIDFGALFKEKGLGTYIEEIRSEWTSEYDFIFIDSRTGITDIGGICTVHLPDVLVLFFTANDSSTEGTRDVLNRARIAQERLPLVRGRLIAVPVPSRDESRTEYGKAAEWRRVFVSRFSDVYQDWLPSGVRPDEAIDALKIPYVPYWSFGEQLPVLLEKSTDPTSISYAYETLARLLATRLGWHEAFKGRSFATSPIARPRKIDDWVTKQRSVAIEGFRNWATPRGVEKRGSAEFVHYCMDADITKDQAELLEIAEHSAIHTFGWPIGVVLRNREELRPRPTNDGIVAKVDTNHDYDYWALTTHGDFYTLTSLFEDDRASKAIFYNTRIVRTAEAILHCVRIYEAFGLSPSSSVEMTVRHSGLKGRRLSQASRVPVTSQGWLNATEDEVTVSATFPVGLNQEEVIAVVKRLCEPLFMVFDFAKFPVSLYEDIVKQFIQGVVT